MKKTKNKNFAEKYKTLKNILKEISKYATKNLEPITAFIHLFIITLFISLFRAIHFGIVEKLITGYFEILTTFILFFIILNIVLSKIIFYMNNGFLGLANFLFFTLGILAVMLNDLSLVATGSNIIIIFWVITIIAIFYENFYRDK